MAKTSEPAQAEQAAVAEAPEGPRTTTGPVLVGFEGGEGGDDALALGRLLAGVQETGCETVTESASLRSPARTLIERAEQRGAATLVVGSPHRGKLGRALLGSVATNVLHQAPCDVVVAPRGYADRHPDRIQRVAVAYDGSPESKLALERGEELARHAGASIEVLVAEDPVVTGLEVDRSLDDAAARVDVLDEALRSLDPALHGSGRRLDPGWRKVPQTIAAAIAAACDDVEADLLVAGCRRKVDRVFLGSVTNKLIDVSPSPVLIVPRPE